MKVIFHIGSKKKPQLGSIREAEEGDLLEFYDGGRYTVRYVDHVVAAKKQIRTQPLESSYGRISDAMWVPFDSVIGISREEGKRKPEPEPEPLPEVEEAPKPKPKPKKRGNTLAGIRMPGPANKPEQV